LLQKKSLNNHLQTNKSLPSWTKFFLENIVILFLIVIVVISVGTDKKDSDILLELGEFPVKLSVVNIVVDGADDERSAIVVSDWVRTIGEVDSDNKGLLIEMVDNVIFLVVVAVVVIVAVVVGADDERTAIVVSDWVRTIGEEDSDNKGLLIETVDNVIFLSVVAVVVGADNERTAIVVSGGVTPIGEVNSENKGLLIETVDNVKFLNAVAVVVIVAVVVGADDESPAIVVSDGVTPMGEVDSDNKGLLIETVDNVLFLSVVAVVVIVAVVVRADDERTAIVVSDGVTPMGEVNSDNKGLLIETVDNVIFLSAVAVVVIVAVVVGADDERTAIVVFRLIVNVVLVLRVLVSLITIEFVFVK
jgi:hypothetical protein